MSSSPRKSPKRWSAQEDAALHEAVTKQQSSRGSKDWHRIAQCLPGRSNKDCRKRWVNQVRGGLRKGAWNQDEDERLRQAVTKYGTRTRGSWMRSSDTVGGGRGYRANFSPIGLGMISKTGNENKHASPRACVTIKRVAFPVLISGPRYTILTRNRNSFDDAYSPDPSAYRSSCESNDSESEGDTDAEDDFTDSQEVDNEALAQPAAAGSSRNDQYDDLFGSSMLTDQDQAMIWALDTPPISERDTVTASDKCMPLGLPRFDGPCGDMAPGVVADQVPTGHGSHGSLALDTSGLDGLFSAAAESTGFRARHNNAPAYDGGNSSSTMLWGPAPTLEPGPAPTDTAKSSARHHHETSSDSFEVTIRIKHCDRTTLGYLLDITQPLKDKVQMEIKHGA
ncbi:hypothetical protein F5Y07DRAFT_399749 [Xylaria sp. FL0933]|nr:hypothetical protein F5Y07DRAFT_399749 [Xylaria sp. FL0933]